MISSTARPIDSTATVLIAEDDVAGIQQLQRDLESSGHRVIHAVDGASALRLVSAHQVNLVLCNAVLPDMDGYEVCRAIKQAPATRDTPVVLLTSADDGAQRERALEAGADDVAVKPIEKAMVLAIVRAQLRIGRLKSQLDDLEGVVVSLARAVEDRDQSNAGLAERVAHWAMELGSAIGLSDEDLTQLYKAALLHDVGTLSVPVAVLSKPGHLDPTEFGQIKKHPVVGEEILSALPRSERLLPAVRHHHERIDGAGYPDGLGGDQIPLFARIIAIADAYVAMTSDRPYRRRRSREEAIHTLQEGAGNQWDKSLVERFLRVVERGDIDVVSDTRSAS